MGKSRQSADLVSDNNIFVDITTDRVGIGTTTPQYDLDVVGSLGVSGVVTASAYYGDGRYLQNILSGVGVATAGGTVGTGATIIDFRGAGISTVTVSTGIATVNITGGGGGGAVSIGTIAPSSPSNGDLWYSPDYARTFVWYDEVTLGIGSTAVWVDAAPFNINLTQLNDLQVNSLVVLNHTDLNTLDVSGISTLGNVVIGSGATDLIVNGNARVTGILTIGTSSITLDGNNNQVNVGTGVTIHHTNGVQVGENAFHSTGLTVNQINATGIITASTFRVGTAVTINSSGLTAGIITASTFRVGTAVTINSSGLTAGIITATSFSGDGSQLTGISIGSSINAGNTSASVTDTGSNGTFTVTTEGTSRLLVNSAGKVVIGGSTPLGLFNLVGVERPSGPASYVSAETSTKAQGGLNWYQDNNANYEYNLDIFATATNESPWGGSNIRFLTTPNGSSTAQERARITRAGNITVGTQTARSSNSTTARVHIEGTDQSTSAITIVQNSNDTIPPRIIFAKSKSTGVNGVTGISSADHIGRLEFNYANGSNIDSNIAFIQATNYRTATNYGGGMIFAVKADGGSSEEVLLLEESGTAIFGGGRGTGTSNGIIDNISRGIVFGNGNRKVYKGTIANYTNTQWRGGGYNNGGYGWSYTDSIPGAGGLYVPGGYFVGSHGENVYSGSCGVVGLGGNGGTYANPGSGGFFQPGFTGQNGSGGVRGGNYAFGGRSHQHDVLYIDRTGNDGALVTLRQDGTEEGTITVSGTTVSYNGGHLSRWSQISGIDPYDKDTRPEILLGTVMSNLDEMCEWITPEQEEVIWTQEEIDKCMSIYGQVPDGVQVGDVKIPYSPEIKEENWQLNKTKVSDVENDRKVAGVFQDWDDDDKVWANDYHLAMTGDFVIRIGSGVIVENGDLLTSAGDGTAKPQQDDIIRSSTIAKVTSNHVVNTYDDGSYCVPCVLMSC